MSQGTLTESTVPPEISLEDWFALPEDAAGELVDGRLEEEEVPDYLHELLVMLLGQQLGNWVFPRGGLVGGSDAKFAVGARQGRKPDLTVYFPGSRRPPARGLISTPPDLAVEVVSPRPRDGLRDRVEKMTEYAAFGISYYWLLDPQLRSLEIFELDTEGRYARVLAATAGTVDDVPGCDGLTIDLDTLWEHVDRLEAETESQ